MNRYLEALERLAMPDDIHIKECEKLGIGLTEDYDLLEQYILKTQESKHYLKWEDLEFKDVQQEIKVKLGNLIYSLWYILERGDQCVELVRNQQQVITLYGSYKEDTLFFKEDVLFFNELHLEVVENE